MTKRILLTGASGFTGRHLVRSANERGYTIIELRSNLTDTSKLNAELASIEFDYVVHLAAISAVTHSNEKEFYAVNLFGSLSLLSAICNLQIKPLKIILASSANIYGNAATSPINESVLASPVNHYAMSKLAMEIMSIAQFGSLPLVIARPFNYTGVGQDCRFVIPKIVQHFIDRAQEIELGNLDVRREYNDVRMVCQTYLDLLEAGTSGQIYNIASNVTFSLNEVISILKDLTAHSIDVKVNPEFVRAREISELAGSVSKLESCVGKIIHCPLSCTLEWMLENPA